MRRNVDANRRIYLIFLITPGIQKSKSSKSIRLTYPLFQNGVNFIQVNSTCSRSLRSLTTEVYPEVHLTLLRLVVGSRQITVASHTPSLWSHDYYFGGETVGFCFICFRRKLPFVLVVDVNEANVQVMNVFSHVR